MSADWFRPSGFATWGWGWAVFTFLGGVPNFVGLIDEPTWLRAGIAAITLAATTFCVVLWRKSVRLDREHRALMARLDRGFYDFGGTR